MTGRPYRKKLIEVALPLDAINKASVREKWKLREQVGKTGARLNSGEARKRANDTAGRTGGADVDDPAVTVATTEAVRPIDTQASAARARVIVVDEGRGSVSTPRTGSSGGLARTSPSPSSSSLTTATIVYTTPPGPSGASPTSEPPA